MTAFEAQLKDFVELLESPAWRSADYAQMSGGGIRRWWDVC